jgi:succinate-semialdehyde dehydrogenase/glutarate-semialdehyde dehydrogenase
MDFPVPPSDLAEDVLTTGDREPLRISRAADGRWLGTVPACQRPDMEAAVDRAAAAQADWADRSPADRADVLRDVADALLDRRADLYDAICIETGKARRDAAEEVADAAVSAQYYARRGPTMLTATRRRGPVPLLTRTREYRDPLGVIGLITPWNYPLTLVVSDALPALLAGNTVVVKADQRTPLTALLARRVLLDAGVPPDAFQVVTGLGPELGPPLIESVDGIGFTGSTAVGRTVAEQAGRALTPVSLELGGKNPLVVLPDADPERAAAGTVRGGFASAGQLCIAIERVYVHEEVADAYLSALVEKTEALTLGVDGAWGPDVGSLLSGAQLAKTRDHVRDAVDRGATLETGGRHRPSVGPWVYEPTVLTDVPDEATLNEEETFGPVVAVHEVPDVETAIREANDSPYGLNASGWGADTDRAEEVARRIRCGTVNVNEAYAAAWSSYDAPMGGMADSGMGRRHGREGLFRWTESQTVATQRGPPIAPLWLPDRQWADLTTGYLRLRSRLGELWNRLRIRFRGS